MQNLLSDFKNRDYKKLLDKYLSEEEKFENSADILSLVGASYLSLSSYDKAIEYFEKALVSQPIFPEVHSRIGQAFKLQGNIPVAIKHFEIALEQKPDFLTAKYDLGLTYLELGKFSECIPLLKEFANKNPSNFMALANLGIAYRKIGDFDNAINTLKATLIINPEYFPALLNLGISLYRKENITEAVPVFQNANKLDPNNAKPYKYLALLNLKLGDIDQVKNNSLRAIVLDPKSKVAYNALGIAYKELNDYKHASGAFLKAMKLDENYAEPFHNLALLLAKKSSPESAYPYAKKAIELDLDNANFMNTLGHIHRNLNQHDIALEKFQLALNIDPSNTASLVHMGVTYSEMGQNDKSVDYYEKALELNPKHPIALSHLSRIKKIEEDDPRIKTMICIVETANISDSHKVSLNFALGSIYYGFKKHEKAFGYLSTGNELRTKELSHLAEEEFGIIDKIKLCFQEDISIDLDESNRQLDYPKSPIFILGMPRSGTSLVEEIITSHSLVYGGGELNTLRNSINFEKLTSQKLDKELFEDIHEQYLSGVNKNGFSEQFITDKMPSNFRFVGLIALAFPEAKIVHTIRNPLATCWSIYMRNFSTEGHAYAYDLELLGKYYNTYKDLMSFWHQKFPGKIYDLNYEKLTENQEEETRKLVDYLQLEWEDSCLQFEKNERAVRTASFQQVRKRMYQGSSKAWEPYRPYLSKLIDIIGEDANP